MFRIDAGRRRCDAGRARHELVARVQVENAILVFGRGVHRLHWRMDVDARRIFRFEHFCGLAHSAIDVAGLHEPVAGVLGLLQAARFGEDRRVGGVGIGALVPRHLERRGRLHRLRISLRDGDDPAGHRAGLVLEDHRLDEARDLLRLGGIDIRDLRAVAHRRHDDLAVDHARQHRIDAVFRRAVGLRRNVDLRQILPDIDILIGGLERDRLEFVGAPALRDLAALDDIGERLRLVRRRMDHTRAARDALLRGRAHQARACLDQSDAAGGAGAAHRVEVHHRAPAAAGDDRAEHGVVELRIVADEIDAHVAPGGAEFLGDDLRHRAGDMLAHVGLADIDGDEPVRRDRIPDRRIVGLRGSSRRGNGLRREAEDEAGGGGAREEAAARQVDAVGCAARGDDLFVLAHQPLRAGVSTDAARVSAAARWMARTMRG